MIIQGDALAVLKTLPDESIDAVITDPPYGLTSGRNGRGPATVGAVFKGFMGLEWDGGVPSAEVWAEARRVAKPGANLLAFGATRRSHRLACAIEDAGWEIQDTIAWIYGHGYPKSKGSLKPALELITVARNGSGPRAMNVDACRIAVEDRAEYEKNHSGDRGFDGTRSAEDRGATDFRVGGGSASDLGRWPANVVHDGSEDVLALFPANAGAAAAVTRRMSDKTRNTFGAFKGNVDEDGSTFRGDSGSAARFFYCARASKAERTEGNTHPTVKPLALMRWLVRLATPPGGKILDPFCGSGSTGVAAALECFGFTGIEINAEFVSIAERRIANVAPLFREEPA